MRRWAERLLIFTCYFVDYREALQELAQEALPELSFYNYKDEQTIKDVWNNKGWDKKYLKCNCPRSSEAGLLERNESMIFQIGEGLKNNDDVIVFAGGDLVPKFVYERYRKVGEMEELTEEQFFKQSKENIANKTVSSIRSTAWNVYEYLEAIPHEVFLPSIFID